MCCPQGAIQSRPRGDGDQGRGAPTAMRRVDYTSKRGDPTGRMRGRSQPGAAMSSRQPEGAMGTVGTTKGLFTAQEFELFLRQFYELSQNGRKTVKYDELCTMWNKEVSCLYHAVLYCITPYLYHIVLHCVCLYICVCIYMSVYMRIHIYMYVHAHTYASLPSFLPA